MCGKPSATICESSRSSRAICAAQRAPRRALVERLDRRAAGRRDRSSAARFGSRPDSSCLRAGRRRFYQRRRPCVRRLAAAPASDARATRSRRLQRGARAPQRLLGVQLGHAGDLHREQRQPRACARRGAWPGGELAEQHRQRRRRRRRRPAALRAARRVRASARARSPSALARMPSGPSTRPASSAHTGTPVSSSAISSTSSSRPPERKPPCSIRSSTAASIGVRTTSGSRPMWRKNTR